MKKLIIAGLALAATLISLPASAQYRGVPCGSVFVQPTARTAGVAGFRQRECDPPRQRAGHNGSNGPYFIGRAHRERMARRPHYGYQQQSAYFGGQQGSSQRSRFSSYSRTSTHTSVRRNSRMPPVTGKMPNADPAVLARQAYQSLGGLPRTPGVGYHFNVAATADQAPKAGCQVIGTTRSPDGMYTFVRRICPRD